MNKLIKEICLREAGKSEVSVGNVRSVLKHLVEITVSDVEQDLEWARYVDKVFHRLSKKKAKKK
jgi:hypothetical protein